MSGERKKFYHRVTVGSTLNATDANTAAFVVEGGASIKGSLFLGGQVTTTGNLALDSTTPSSDAGTGALTLLGGVGIGNTTNATSYTSGGAMTLAGGAAVGKDLLVNGMVAARSGFVTTPKPGATTGGSMTWGMRNQNNVTSSSDPSTYSMQVDTSDNLALTSKDSNTYQRTHLQVSPTAGLQTKSKQSDQLVSLNLNREDKMTEQIFTSSTNVVNTPADVTDLSFATSSAFICHVYISIVATTNAACMYELRGIKNGNGAWLLLQDKFMGDDMPIIFSISNGGQVQYVKAATGGHISTTMAWRVMSLFDV